TADGNRALVGAQVLHRLFLVMAHDGVHLGQRAGFGAADEAVKHDVFAGMFALDIEGDHAVRVFVKPWRGELEVRPAQLGIVASEHGKRLAEQHAPARTGRGRQPGGDEWAQVHASFSSHRWDVTAELHEIGNDPAKWRNG